MQPQVECTGCAKLGNERVSDRGSCNKRDSGLVLLCRPKCGTLQTGAFLVKGALRQPAKTSPTPPPDSKRRSRPLQIEYDRFLHEEVGLVALISVLEEEKKKRVGSTVITPPSRSCSGKSGFTVLLGAPLQSRACLFGPDARKVRYTVSDPLSCGGGHE